jgi:hypothetical protein
MHHFNYATSSNQTTVSTAATTSKPNNTHIGLLQPYDAKENSDESIHGVFREQRGDAADAMDIDAVDKDGNWLQQQQQQQSKRMKAEASATAGIEPAVLREHFHEKTDIDIQAKDK